MSLDPPPLQTMALDCPHCGGAFQVRAEFRGLEVACPHCQHAIEVPRVSGAVPPPPPPPADLPQGVSSAEPPPAQASSPPAPPGEPELPTKVETPAAPEEPPSEKPEPPRELTREERDRLRRRFRLLVAVFAAVVLAIALFALLQQ